MRLRYANDTMKANINSEFGEKISKNQTMEILYIRATQLYP